MTAKFQRIPTLRLLVLFIVFVAPFSAQAYELNEKLTIEGTLTGIYQYGDFDVKGIKDTGRGAGVLDLGINFHPTDKDGFYVLLSYAAGNALNTIVPFSLVPYADDLEADLKDINGRNRDYLLEAWYKHKFVFSKDISLGITGGIIDSTRYIDDNKFANCEVTQFMNSVFVNHKTGNFPSYDLGSVLELDISNFSARGLFMSTKNEEGREYNYYAMQLGYKIDTPLGEGNYRLYGFTTNKRFQDWDETGEERLQGFGVSADQQLSSIIGVFARVGWQNDAAIIEHEAAYSGGININGRLWGRQNDEIGIGYAYLKGGDKGDIDSTNVFETYAKFKISKFTDVSPDIQYIYDNLKHDKDRKGFIYGVRANAYF